MHPLDLIWFWKWFILHHKECSFSPADLTWSKYFLNKYFHISYTKYLYISIFWCEHIHIFRWKYSYVSTKRKATLLQSNQGDLKKRYSRKKRARYPINDWYFSFDFLLKTSIPLSQKVVEGGIWNRTQSQRGRAHKVIWGGTLTSFSNNYKYRCRKRIHWFSFYFGNEVIDAAVPHVIPIWIL